MKKAMTLIIACLMLATVFGACFSVSAAVNPYIKSKPAEGNRGSGTTQSGIETLKGTVKRWGGEPLKDAYVYIVGGHISIEDFDLSIVIAQDVTDAQGTYIFSLPEGKYTMLVLRNGFGSIKDKWLPGFRLTTISSGEITTENFNLIFVKSNEQINTVSQVQQMQACLI